MRLVWDCSEAALSWAATRIPNMHGRGFHEAARACAFVRDDGAIAGVVAFHDWQPEYRTIQVSAASDDARWLLARQCWLDAWDYAFRACGCDKVWTLTPHDNIRALRFVRALGFTAEAILDHQFGRNKHAVFSRRYSWDHYEQATRSRAA